MTAWPGGAVLTRPVAAARAVRSGDVAVGADGSPASRAALSWAIEEASRAGCGLAICHAQPPAQAGHGAQADEVMAHAVTTAVHHLGPARVVPVVVQRDAAGLLLAASRDARLVVVGTDGYAGYSARRTSPAVLRLAAAARCPVVVHPVLAGGPGPFAGSVVAGVDGSAASRAALAFGFGHAERCGLPLAAVHVTGDPETGELPEADTAAQAACHPEVPVQYAVIGGTPGTALVRVASGAALLVIGDRGHGGVRSLLGSAAHHLTGGGAACPVAVVKALPYPR